MVEDDVFYTRTMAKVYADQGNLLKAAEIYRHLLSDEPERQDLVEALSEIETKLGKTSPDDLITLFIQWVDLLLTCHNMQKLMRLRNNLRDGN
ncbi:MAG: hypothetical protein JRE65_06760 [Deltaproteobacteria bacterium]|nr:hypothetical protein [Deltaproteobacteria bacterium]